MKFQVTVEERVSSDFEVEAEDLSQALKIAEEKYKKGEWVFEPGELLETKIQALNLDTHEESNWIEL